jgi:predicted MFS family arabinose efflux permease
VSATRSLLADRPFRLLVTARGLSVLGDMLVPVALAFAVLGISSSPADLGFVLSARVLPMVLLFAAGGVAADRFPRRTVMALSSTVSGVMQAAMAVLVIGGWAEIWHLAALSVVKGAATAFYLPASNSIVPDIVPRDRLQPAYGVLSSTGSAAEVLGPVGAGVIVATIGAGWALAFDAVTFAAGALLLLGLPAVRHTAQEARPSLFRELAEGWSQVRSRTWLWVMIASNSLFQLVVIASIAVLGPIVAKDSLGGASAWALIVTAFGAGGLLGGVAAIRLRPRFPLRFGFLLMGLAGAPSLAMLAIPAPVPVIALTELLSGFAIGVFGTIESTVLAHNVPASALSRVYSYDWMGSMALRPVGLAVVGPIAAVAGLEATLVAGSALTLAIVAWPLATAGLRNLPSHTADRPPTAAAADPLKEPA